jgi:hypothetical protein
MHYTLLLEVSLTSKLLSGLSQEFHVSAATLCHVLSKSLARALLMSRVQFH